MKREGRKDGDEGAEEKNVALKHGVVRKKGEPLTGGGEKTAACAGI